MVDGVRQRSLEQRVWAAFDVARWPRPDVATVAGAALIVAGAGALTAGLATPAKAMLGQALLERAWDAAQEGRVDADEARPWPGADIAPVAKLRFPKLGEERLVLNEASGEGMAWGPGHVAGTAPLGAPGVSAAAAHRDTHFRLLKDVEHGDLIELETIDGRTATYRVVESGVVDARTWRFPAAFDGPDVLALATCWPFESVTPGPERYVLFAERM